MANHNPRKEFLVPSVPGKRGAGGLGGGRQKGTPNRLKPERVEEELRRMATFDPAKLYKKTGRRTCTLRDIAEMDADTRACIASIKVKAENVLSGDGHQDTVVEIKLWDKVRALELCARALGMFKDRLEIEHHLKLEDIIAGSRSTS